MVLYRITLVPLAEELRSADSGGLSPFYADDASFDGSARRSAQLLKILIKRGPDRGYFPKPAKSLFILDIPGQEEAAKREFAAEGLTLNFDSGGRYLGAYLGRQKGHWEQIILRQPGEPTITILIQEGLTKGDPLLMVLYRITLVPLAEELRSADSGGLSPFYADDASFDGSARRSAQLLKILIKRGPDRGYFPKPAKSLFILDIPGQEEAAKREFAAEGLTLNFDSGGRYLGAYLGRQKELQAWVKPQVDAWAHGFRVSGKIARRHPQLAYAGLVMSL